MARIYEMISQPLVTVGTATGCAQSFTHFLPAGVEPPRNWQSHFSCQSVAARFGVDAQQLLAWNPSLHHDDCVLQPGVKYCVVRIEKSESPSTSLPDKTSERPPICTFDPKKGEYDCPDPPPICSFDPQKGEYICPSPVSNDNVQSGKDEENIELK